MNHPNDFGFPVDLQFFDEMNSDSQFNPHGDFSKMDALWLANVDPELRCLTQPTPVTWQIQHQFQQQSQLQQPMQRFIQEPERTFFSAAPLSVQSGSFGGMTQREAPIQSIPRGVPMAQGRSYSPSPSQGALTSTCSSALSPPAENDWSQDSIFSPQIRHPSVPMAQFQSEDNWFHQFNDGVNPGVQLSQIQGFSDMTQEAAYDNDEGYDEIAMKAEYGAEVENRFLKTEGANSSYRYPSDEGLGASIKDEGSPQNSTIHVDHDATSEADAEGDIDIDGDVLVAEEEISDTEYTPKSTRTRKRTATTKSSSPPAKRARNSTSSKPNSKTTKNNGQHTCKACNHTPFKDATALQRHTASAHTRAFICVFAFAGCTSTFASKNEWKRHVSSQHLNLSAWVCELGACGKHAPKSTSTAPVGAEFNRKDLFTQHLRRMHAPFAVKRQQKKNPEWEQRLKDLAVECLKTKRQAPVKLRCPVDGCTSVFEGTSCWDERMEHVGKHLEKAARDGTSVEQERDELLITWASREGIIEPRPASNNGWRLVIGGRERVGDEDAEGEAE